MKIALKKYKGYFHYCLMIFSSPTINDGLDFFYNVFKNQLTIYLKTF